MEGLFCAEWEGGIPQAGVVGADLQLWTWTSCARGTGQPCPSPTDSSCSSSASALGFPWLWWDELKGVTHVQQ